MKLRLEAVIFQSTKKMLNAKLGDDDLAALIVQLISQIALNICSVHHLSFMMVIFRIYKTYL